MHPPRAILVGIATALVAGCAAAPPAGESSADAPAATGAVLAHRPYTIGIGDRVRLDAPSVPELHEREAPVRDDGRINLPLLGAVFVAGRTPAQLGSELEEQLRRYYLAPVVRASVTVHGSRTWTAEAGRVRVTRPYTARDQPGDALEVVRVSGFAPVRLLRPDERGRLREVAATGEPLEAGDVVRIDDATATAGGAP